MNLLNTILWKVDPVAFSIANFEIKWYGIMYALAFLFSYFLAVYWFKRAKLPLNKVANLSILILIAGVLGARLGEFLFYDFKTLFQNPLKVLQIKAGGMASHGAFIAIVLSTFFYSRKNNEFSFLWMLDRLAIQGALVVTFMRIGNLMNSELVGKPTRLSWGFIFEKVDKIPRHPTVLYEAIVYFILFLIFFFIDKKYFSKIKNGYLTVAFLLVLVPARVILEFSKANAIHTQDLSVYLILGGFGLLFYLLFFDKSSNKL